MKLPRFVENWVVRMAITRSGAVVTKAVSAAIAWGVSSLAEKVPGVEQYVNEYVLAGLLFWVIDYAYNLLPQEIQKRYGAELQAAVNDIRRVYLKVDGYVGPVTVATVRDELAK